MAITSYNIAPYYDDHNVKDSNGRTVGDKNYLRILFQPGQGVQTRELNQMQSLLQTQIDRLGSSLYRDGENVLDGESNYIADVIYVDVVPSGTFTGETLATSLLLQPTIELRTTTSSGGIYAKILGAEVKSNTSVRVYIEPLSESADSPNVRLSTKVPITTPLYYKDSTQITSVTSGVISSQTTTSAFGTVEGIGYAFGLTVEEGIFFVKGSFVHTPAMSKFWIKNSKAETVKGDANLIVSERIVTSSQDTTLLDNASGSYNYSAPGADRYQITLDLGFFEPVANISNIPTQNSGVYIKDTVQTFDIKRLFEIEDGGVILEKNQEQSNLSKRLATRTYEESGNYTLKPFRLSLRELVDTSVGAGVTNDPLYTVAEANNLQPFNVQSATEGVQKFVVQLDPSTAYIEGYRYNYPYKTTLVADKARTTSRIVDEAVTLPIGNYIEVDLVNSPNNSSPVVAKNRGYFASSPAAKFNIDDRFFNPQSSQSSPNASPSNNIPVIRAAQYISDTSASDTNVPANGQSTYQWRFYLSNGVDLATIKRALPNLKNIRNISGQISLSDKYSNAGSDFAVLGTENNTSALGIKERQHNTNIFELPPGTGVQRVTSVKYDMYERRTGSFGALGDGRASITLNSSSSNDTFTSTSLSDKFDYTIIRKSGHASPFNFRLINPENFEIASGSSSSTITLQAVTGQDSPLFGDSPAGDTFIAYVPITRQKGVDGSRTKTLKTGSTDIAAVLDTGTGAAGQIITLDDQDIDISTIANANMGENWEIFDDGQSNPEFYDDVKIKLKAAVSFSNTVITYSYYEHGAGDYFTVNSYGDYTQDSPGLIAYDDIETFKEKSLANFIDFRTKRRASLGDARVGTSYGPVSLIPNRSAVVTLSHYEARQDRVIIDNRGIIRVIQGNPGRDPVLPELPPQSMTLYTYFVPAYTSDAKDIRAEYVDNARYTMRDIGRLKRRVDDVEYYTALSLLEQDAVNKPILNSDGSERFKNGFLVSNFKNDTIANPLDKSYLAAHDHKRGILRPYYRRMPFRMFYQYPEGEAGTTDYSPTNVDDFYIAKTANIHTFNTVTNRGVPTSGRPNAINVRNFRIGSTPDGDTNGFYVLYNTNVNGYPEYRLSTATTSLDESTRRIVKTAEDPRWEIQSRNTDGTYSGTYRTTAAGASGNDAEFPTEVGAGGWSNTALQAQNVATTGADAVVQDISSDVISAILPDAATYAKTDKYNTTGKNSLEMLSLYRGDSEGRETIFQQLNASRTVSIQPYEVATYLGKLKISPSSDQWIDDERRPSTVVQDDTAMIVLQFLDQETDVFNGVLGSLWESFENVGPVGTTTVSNQTTQRGNRFTQTQVFEDSVDQLRTGTFNELTSNSTLDVPQGERVVDLNIIPSVRSRDISLYASGLKPNTRIYVYLDGKDVSRYAAATTDFKEYATHEAVQTYNNQSPPDSRTSGGSFQTNDLNHYELPLFTTPETGEFFGTLRIPANDDMRFRTGNLSLKITSSPLDNDLEADTFAETTYNAFGMEQIIEETIVSTRLPDIETTAIEEERTLVTQRTVTRSWRVDPVAQTFEIDAQKYPNGVCLTDVDLFFAEKPDYIADCQIYIVPTKNGLPSQTVIPGSRTHKPYHQVNVSANGRNETDGSVILSNATNFKFDYPIYLKADTEYALVVYSKSTDYRLWSAEIGGSNITNAGLPITANSFGGVLCKSQNASTWTADQTKDLMFRMRKGVFNLSDTYVFHTKASGVYGDTNQQKIGQAQAAEVSNVTFSSFMLQLKDIVIPGTSISYHVDFATSNGLLDRATYGIPNKLESNQLVELIKEIDTVALGVNNIIITATLSVPSEIGRTTDGYSDITPMIDLESAQLLGLQNIVQKTPTAQTLINPYPSLQEAVNNQLGFVTKEVGLTNPADNLRVFLLTNRISADANLEVYTRIRSSSSNTPLSEMNWDKMEVKGINGGLIKQLGSVSPSIRVNGDLNSFSDSEYYYSPGPGKDITDYAVKIAFSGTDSAKIVKVKDFRAIASS